MGLSEKAIKENVRKLIQQMTLEEKTAQLGALMMIDVTDGIKLDPRKKEHSDLYNKSRYDGILWPRRQVYC